MDEFPQRRLVHRADAGGAFSFPDVGLVFIAEVSEGAQRRIGRREAQAAEACVLDHFAEFLELVQVFHDGAAVADPLQDAQHLGSADAAGDAFAATLVAAEVHEEPGNVYHAALVVHDDEPAGAHDGAQRRQVFVVDGGVEVIGGNAAAAGSSGLGSLEAVAFGYAAADVIDDFTERYAHGNLDEAGIVDLASQGEYLRAFALFSADAGVPVAAAVDDRGDVAVGLDVVDQGRASP